MVSIRADTKIDLIGPPYTVLVVATASLLLLVTRLLVTCSRLVSILSGCVVVAIITTTVWPTTTTPPCHTASITATRAVAITTPCIGPALIAMLFLLLVVARVGVGTL